LKNGQTKVAEKAKSW